jgi:hypothetical protein
MLIPLLGIEILEFFCGGELDPFVNYFVKIKFDGYCKIMIPAQH